MEQNGNAFIFKHITYLNTQNTKIRRHSGPEANFYFEKQKPDGTRWEAPGCSRTVFAYFCQTGVRNQCCRIFFFLFSSGPNRPKSALAFLAFARTARLPVRLCLQSRAVSGMIRCLWPLKQHVNLYAHHLDQSPNLQMKIWQVMRTSDLNSRLTGLFSKRDW